jgi:hypothetical protein
LLFYNAFVAGVEYAVPEAWTYSSRQSTDSGTHEDFTYLYRAFPEWYMPPVLVREVYGSGVLRDGPFYHENETGPDGDDELVFSYQWSDGVKATSRRTIELRPNRERFTSSGTWYKDWKVNDPYQVYTMTDEDNDPWPNNLVPPTETHARIHVSEDPHDLHAFSNAVNIGAVVLGTTLTSGPVPLILVGLAALGVSAAADAADVPKNAVQMDKYGMKNDPICDSLFIEGIGTADWHDPSALASLKAYSVANMAWRVQFRPSMQVEDIVYDHWGENGYEDQSFGQDWRPLVGFGFYRYEFYDATGW